MNVDTYKLKVIFLQPVLGSQPTKDIASEFLAHRSGFDIPEDELETLPDVLERGTTIFHRDAKTGEPLLYDYHLKGFLKEAGRVMNGKVTGKVKNLRSKVDSLVFVSPRRIPLMPSNGNSHHDMDYLERPLRAETARGPRVALARSEMLQEGTWFTCGLTVLPGEIDEEVLRDLLDYGFYKGLGQWRNGGWGSFRYELVEE